MWGIKMSPSSGAATGSPRLSRRQRARKLTPRCVLEALLDWLCSLPSPSGVAYLVSVLCFVVQNVCIDAFLVVYMSSAALLTLAVEIPLLVHLAAYWREESAHRSAPSEWLAYSWVHAAKVVVLFCRVMPRLPSSSNALERGGNRRASIWFGIQFDHFFTPTTLANVLLITPVFYSLLMFRTSKAIFGRFTRRITVDLILHYDMLWHVVIDMVDQVDMFHYARLPEWEASQETLRVYQDALLRIQTVIPLFIFLSMVLQAQAFPGVVTDHWKIPEPVRPTEEQEQEQELSGSVFGGTSRFVSRLASRSRPLATLRERTLSGTELAPGPEASPAPAGSPSSETLRPPPPPAPPFLEPAGGLAGPPLAPPAGRPASASPRAPAAPQPAALQALPPELWGSIAGAELAATPEERLGHTSASSGERLTRRSRPSQLSALWEPQSSSFTRRLVHTRGALSGSRRLSASARVEVLSRERYLRLERERRRRLQDLVGAIHRQNIIIARKRSALISIFFTDIPFLTIRLWLWALLGNKYVPGLGVKNAICIILNGIQVTIVRFADRQAFRDIQAQLVQYRVKFAGAGAAAGPHGSPDGVDRAAAASQSPAPEGLLPPTPSDRGPNSALSTPQGSVAAEGRTRAAAAAALQAAGRRTYSEAERRVARETVRSTGVCVHFWSLLVAFGFGFALAKGEHFFAALVVWATDGKEQRSSL